MRPPVYAILFDLDGTLIATKRLYLEAYRQTVAPQVGRLLTDAAGMFSWRMEKKQQEGGYRDERTVDIDHLAGLAITTKKDRRDTTKIPPFVLDVLSAVYYVRTQNLAPGDSVLFDNYDNGKIYPLKIVVHRKEKIKTAAGKFECFVVEPFAGG